MRLRPVWIFNGVRKSRCMLMLVVFVTVLIYLYQLSTETRKLASTGVLVDKLAQINASLEASESKMNDTELEAKATSRTTEQMHNPFLPNPLKCTVEAAVCNSCYERVQSCNYKFTDEIKRYVKTAVNEEKRTTASSTITTTATTELTKIVTSTLNVQINSSHSQNITKENSETTMPMITETTSTNTQDCNTTLTTNSSETVGKNLTLEQTLIETLELSTPTATQTITQTMQPYDFPETKEDCTPKLIRYECSSAEVTQSQSAFACTNDIVVEQLDYHTQFSCIRRIAELARQKSRTRIPRIGHSIYYFAGGKPVFKFHYHLSVLSLIRYLKPSVYFFWNDGLPTGRWWIEMLQRVTSPSQRFAQLVGVNDTSYSLRFYSVYRQPPTDVYGTRMTRYPKFHASDVTRIEYLVLFGGVYLDFDAFAVNSLDALLDDADWVQGYEVEGSLLNNGVLLGAPNSDFGKLWHCQYASGYNPEAYIDHSVRLPHKLAEQCPHLIRREARSLNQPNNYNHNDRFLYGDNVYFDLKHNYVVHGWMWQYGKQDVLDPVMMRFLNFTLARVWRHIYDQTPL